jgi:regulator of protease activity HflC (stomatin/prohibitin superfamily)
VDADEACLVIQNGAVTRVWGTGFHWRFTPTTDVACFRVSRQTLEASPGQAGSGADFNDDPVDARTSDGQLIDAVSFRIAFRIPRTMPDFDAPDHPDGNLRRIYTDVGASSNGEVVESVVSFYARPLVRRVMQVHASSDLLYGDLATISQELEDMLRPVYAAHGVILEDFLLSKPDFNDVFEGELLKQWQADQQHTAGINSANANATVTALNQGAAGEQAINQANINATVTAQNAETDANRTVSQANAEATAAAVQMSAYGSADAYLQAQLIDAMRGWPVQVIGANGVLPELGTSSPTPFDQASEEGQQ